MTVIVLLALVGGGADVLLDVVTGAWVVGEALVVTAAEVVVGAVETCGVGAEEDFDETGAAEETGEGALDGVVGVVGAGLATAPPSCGTVTTIVAPGAGATSAEEEGAAETAVDEPPDTAGVAIVHAVSPTPSTTASTVRHAVRA